MLLRKKEIERLQSENNSLKNDIEILKESSISKEEFMLFRSVMIYFLDKSTEMQNNEIIIDNKNEKKELPKNLNTRNKTKEEYINEEEKILFNSSIALSNISNPEIDPFNISEL